MLKYFDSSKRSTRTEQFRCTGNFVGNASGRRFSGQSLASQCYTSIRVMSRFRNAERFGSEQAKQLHLSGKGDNHLHCRRVATALNLTFSQLGAGGECIPEGENCGFESSSQTYFGIHMHGDTVASRVAPAISAPEIHPKMRAPPQSMLNLKRGAVTPKLCLLGSQKEICK